MNDKSPTQQRFLDVMDKILPVVKYGTITSNKVTISGEEHELPEKVLPVVYPIAFDSLSILFGVEEGTHIHWLQNQDIEIAQGRVMLDDVLTKAYQNLFERVKDTISIIRINDHTGMLTNCQNLESSFIITNEVWDYICKNLNAKDLVYAIPTQEVFIFCNSQSTEDIHFIREKVNELFQDHQTPRKISPNLYLRRETGETTLYE